MDPDTKRWIFDITAWIAGVLAIIMLIADAAASDRLAMLTASNERPAECGSCLVSWPGGIRGEV
jgi:hypothetical protein